nr:MAG TPA: hypothetical protein [Caudoviricetes sp.]
MFINVKKNVLIIHRHRALLPVSKSTAKLQNTEK